MKKYWSLLLWILFISCKDKNKYPYAIRDFRKELQPHLTRMVSAVYVMGYDSAFEKMVTNEELKQLAISEHPLLRAESLNLLLESKMINSMDIIMDHLDDTALIVRDVGEFGVDYISVSDYMLYEASWKNRADKVRTIDKVLSQHNYLRSAHLLLQYLAPEEKYYAYIKDMATRTRKRDSYTSTEINPEEREAALYGLAKFKKKEDIPAIKNQLMENSSGIGWLSFQLMQEFPDTSYLEVYEKYYSHSFSFNFKFDKASNSVDFIKSIVGYKNVRSAALLQAILDKKDFKMDPVYYEYIRDEIKYATWQNRCKAYEHINKQFEKEMRNYEENSTALPVVQQQTTPDSIAPPLRWLQQ